MCVGLPARVVTIKNGMALVDASGAKREVSAELMDHLDPGDYVMVHAGMAIAKITMTIQKKRTTSWRICDGNEEETDGAGNYSAV